MLARFHTNDEGRSDRAQRTDASLLSLRPALDADGGTTVHPNRQVDPDIMRRIDRLEENESACRGKRRLLHILLAAGVPEANLTRLICADLPTWEQVTELYGDEPIVHGQETCAHYQSLIATASVTNHTPIPPMPRVAGLFHTGSNAMAVSLSMNWKKKQNYRDYDVPWGKHLPPIKYRWYKTIPRNNTDDKRLVLPIVLIRDPFRWMQTMVR